MDDRDERRGEGWWPEPDDAADRPPDREGGEEPAQGSDRKRRGGESGEGGKGRDGRRPPSGLASPGKSRPGARYSMFVGLAFVAVILVALFNLIGDDESGILGAGAAAEGLPLAEFAVPDVRGGIEKDANIAQDDCESSRNPCPEDQRRTPACEIDAPGAIRVCDLFDRPLAISFWFTRGGDCLPSQDAFDAVARRYRGRVNFLSINVRDELDTVAEIVREHGWRVPVGLDRDGAVSNLYRVGVCPTIVLAYPGGILRRAAIRPGNYTAAQIDRMVGELLAAARRRAAQDR